MVLTAEDEILFPLCTILIYTIMRRFRKREVDRRCWVKPWIRRRNALGAHHALLSELRNEDQTNFKNFVRMDPAAFDELLELVTPLIKRRDTWLLFQVFV